jgi:hypothetical protein
MKTCVSLDAYVSAIEARAKYLYYVDPLTGSRAKKLSEAALHSHETVERAQTHDQFSIVYGRRKRNGNPVSIVDENNDFLIHPGL